MKPFIAIGVEILRFSATFAASSNILSEKRLFGYKEGRRERAQRNPGNQLLIDRKGANTRPETEL